MHEILCVVGHKVVSQTIKKHGGGMMKLTQPSKKKDNFGKSDRRVEIKKSIFKQKGRQSQLHTVFINYRGLKLVDQVMKVMEHILATIIRTQVDMVGFMPGRETTDTIFIL